MNRRARLPRAKAPETQALPGWAAAVDDVLASPGHPLDREARLELENRLGQDFSQVCVHSDATAAASADAVDAVAYTVGNDVVFAAGQYRPRTPEGRQLLAHELTHVLQHSPASAGTAAELTLSSPHNSREHEADAVARGATPAATVSRSPSDRRLVHRQHREPGPVTVRSPVAEEMVTLLSDISAAHVGRSLTATERALARQVFGDSIDFARVRLIPTDILDYRTVGNNIRVPQDFGVDDEYMAQTLIHELTHVWQYQHGGTSYLSHSVQTQIAAARRGNRNFAYAYELAPGTSFFDFTPEQQASIVENYFSMVRDQVQISRAGVSGGIYNSNHQGPDGFPTPLNAAQRTAEINRELPVHQHAIAQLRAALPQTERAIMLLRASEIIRIPGGGTFPDPAHDLSPIKPVLEIRF